MESPLFRFRQGLLDRKLDGAILAAPESLSPVTVRHLSGFTGSSSYLVIGLDRAVLLTDFRYTEQAEAEAPLYQVRLHAQSADTTIMEIVRDGGFRRVGIEAHHITHAMFEAWAAALPGVTLEDLGGLPESLRLVKTPDEIQAIRRAASIADSALAHVLPTLPGRTERDAARELESRMLLEGADGLAFPTILVSGPRGSLPHGKPSDRVIQPGDLVTVDFGARWNGYHSDETVTVAVGEAAPWQRDIFDLVYRAQQAGIGIVKPGTRASEVDAACRDIIRDAGHGEHFGHGTGHGVGLLVHEAPFCSGRPGAPDWVLEAGMTLTVEPGVYIPGVGGVRLEDTLVVTEKGAERLTGWPKAWQSV